MHIGIGVWAFVCYIGFILAWNLIFRRRISEAMLLAMFVAAAFGGIENIPSLVWDNLRKTSVNDTRLAAMLFVAMSIFMAQTGIITRLINILNSLLGKVRGGPAYISVLASALFGMLSGSGTGNSAAVGSITIPWLKETGWSPEMAATMNSGNAGLGISIPPSSTMFLMLGFAEVATYFTVGDVYIALTIAGLYAVIYRLFLVRWFVHRYRVGRLPDDKVFPLQQTFHEGGTSTLLFLGILIPMLLTMGPLADTLAASRFTSDGVDAINLIIWVPVLIILISAVEGRKYLPKSGRGWYELLMKSMKLFGTASATMVGAMTGSGILSKVGFGKDLLALLDQIDPPRLLMVVAIGIICILIAGPLSSTATTTMMGPVGFLAMVNVGVSPVLALAALWLSSLPRALLPPARLPSSYPAVSRSARSNRPSNH